MVVVARVGEGDVTTYMQEFSDCFRTDYDFFTHETWISSDYFTERAFIFGLGPDEVEMLRSMKPEITQFAHDGKLWTYKDEVRVAVSGFGEELEPRFKFSASPNDTEYFAASYVLECLKFD